MPDFKAEVRLRLARLKLEPTRESALVEEMAEHLEQRFDELVTRGATPAAAREAVLNELGDGTRLEKELLRVERQVRVDPAMPEGPGLASRLAYLSKDLRYALRALRLNPGFAAVAILSLALGIGANTAIFQLLDAVTLRTLPVKEPGELVFLRVPNSKGRHGTTRGNAPVFTNAIWEQIRDRQLAFTGMATWNSNDFNLAKGGRARIARGIYVNGDYFNALGVTPLLGRVFSAADDQRGCGIPGVVASYGFWQTELGGDDAAVGRKLSLEGHPVEVIGVTPPGFYGLEVGKAFDVAVPICSEKVIAGEFSILDRRDGWWLGVVGRLKPGWTSAKATAQLESISPSVFQATLPADFQPKRAQEFLQWKMAAKPAGTGVSGLRQEYEEPLWILLALAGMVLLIACANLANLMFARANAREREIAVRLALGATRTRIMQPLLMETLLLSATGALAGILLAQGLTRILVSFLSTQAGGVTLNLALDWRVIGFTAAVAAMTCLVFGLMPAIRSTGTPPIVAMKAGARGATAGRRRFSTRRLLVVLQVATSMVLVGGAVLFVRTFQNLVTLDAGFRKDGILTADFDFTQANISPSQRNRFKQDLVDRLQAIPGVLSAAAVENAPFSGDYWNEEIHFNAPKQSGRLVADFNRVSPGFFKTMDIPLVKGRDFGPDDTITAPAVAVVSELFVHNILQDADPMGAVFRVDEGAGKPESPYQIIGVVRDVKSRGMRDTLRPMAYLAMSQKKEPEPVLSAVLRSDLAVTSLTSSIERKAAEVDPSIGIHFSVLKTQIRDSLQRERLMASLSGFFGFLAGILATVGLYGVMSYIVVRRRSEIGIRIALGADRGRVLALIMREAVFLLAAGLTVGAALSLASTRVASALLFGLKPNDPLTLFLAAGMLALVAMAASYFPAFRAARIDPLEALREE
jgi:predicted permease